MAFTKNLVLALTCLKEVGVKGLGPQKIMAIGNAIKDRNLKINSYNDLATIMSEMKEKVIKSVTLSNLLEADRIAQNIINQSKNLGINFVSYFDEEYPPLLRKTINEEGKICPPIILWYLGDLSITELPGIAIIGTREATPEGIAGGTYLAGEFAQRGFNIISGLALGCDTSAHMGALRIKGKTTAFLANGLDLNSIYPPENKSLAEDIIKNGGLLLSEYHIGTPVSRYNLVARDRLQAGMSLATVVIQTGENGGTMHAATTTLKAGKPLYSMYFKDVATRSHEKCLGNELLVNRGAKYIKGDDDLDQICDFIMNQQNAKLALFEV